MGAMVAAPSPAVNVAGRGKRPPLSTRSLGPSAAPPCARNTPAEISDVKLGKARYIGRVRHLREFQNKFNSFAISLSSLIIEPRLRVSQSWESIGPDLYVHSGYESFPH